MVKTTGSVGEIFGSFARKLEKSAFISADKSDAPTVCSAGAYDPLVSLSFFA
ncbi:hypothetical protein [Agrobacterium arsenijevicii]|uniref:hypothetical protein n=1 Tax=Agrobacterium arsenijevicii TaxID=1585697 RepID=UPI003305E39E